MLVINIENQAAASPISSFLMLNEQFEQFSFTRMYPSKILCEPHCGQ